MKRSRSYHENGGSASPSEGRGGSGTSAKGHGGSSAREGSNAADKEKCSVEEEDFPPSKTRSIKDLGRQKEVPDRSGAPKGQLHRAGSTKRHKPDREDRGKVRSMNELSSRGCPAEFEEKHARSTAGRELVKGDADDDAGKLKAVNESNESEREEGELTPDVEDGMGKEEVQCSDTGGERSKDGVIDEAQGPGLEQEVVGDVTGPGRDGEKREGEKDVEVEASPSLPAVKEPKAEAQVVESLQVDWKRTQESKEVPGESDPPQLISNRKNMWTDLRPRIDTNADENGASTQASHDSSKCRELTLCIGGLGQEALGKGKEKKEATTENLLDMKQDEDQKLAERRRRNWVNGELDLLNDLQKQKRSKLGVPFVSQCLPDTSLSLGSSDPSLAAGDHERSVHSLGATRTLSTGYTNSLSLSHSHPFMHDPSCSLTRNSFENQEVSCGSHQISQGNDQASYGSWRLSDGREPESSGFVAVSRRTKPRRELPLYQQMVQNGSQQIVQGSLGSDRVSDRALCGPDVELEGNVRLPKILLPIQETKGHFHMSADKAGESQEKCRLIHRESAGRRHEDAWYSPLATGSQRENWSDQQRNWPEVSAGKGAAKSLPERVPSQDWKVAERVSNEQSGSKSLMSSEKIGLHELVSEPIPIMARKLQVLPNSYLQGLKDSLREMLGSIERREEFVVLQKILQKRKDLTTDVLLRSHSTQLELLVAVKTGILAFLHPNIPVTHSALVEIFFQTKCRNQYCQNQLPADDCECSICSAKTGFCNACMCVVCSKFDGDANTCRWIGCDFCLHWCHTDCGIRMGYIAPGASEMQFRCIACEHTSELFGFVKEVFTACAKVWNKDVLSKELDCVRRIFHGSEDLKGKQLCRKAEQMLMQLENMVDCSEVCRSMMRFFTDGDPELGGVLWNSGFVGKETVVTELAACDTTTGCVRESTVKTIPAGVDKPLTESLERARTALQNYDRELIEKRTEAAELQSDRAQKKAQIEELESIVRIKQAEAKMFQMRADEARKEAEGLHRIVLAKYEKVEEEYAFKSLKLRLAEAEDKRRKRHEESQLLEKAEIDYNMMKARMMNDIQDFLVKMESTKRQVF